MTSHAAERRVENIPAQIKDVTEAEPGFMLGKLVIFGVEHHVEFIRVHIVNNCLEAWAHPENENIDRYEDVQKLHPGCYQTFKIPGFAGQYICVAFPMSLT